MVTSNTTDSNRWPNLNSLFNEPPNVINRILGTSDDPKGEVDKFRKLFNIASGHESAGNKEGAKNLKDIGKLIEEENSSSMSSQVTNPSQDEYIPWSARLKKGKCSHCGRPAMPGEYTCYSCNPK